ncbi:MAG TPA: LCP family protein [Anaerolineae bacterium]
MRQTTFKLRVATAISVLLLTACASPVPSPTPVPTRVTAIEPSATPTLAPTQTVPSTPTAPPAPTQTLVVQQIKQPQDSLIDVLVKPMMDEAQKRRTQRAKSDPNYFKRVDKELNDGRVNVLLFGYGETHEPPVTERAYIGSHTIISYNTRTQSADIISITHDTRAPEIERKLGISGKPGSATRIDQGYRVGGFELMRETLENATGLSMDFQISFDDVAIKDFVDDVFGGVEVNVPMAFDVHPFYLKGKKYPAGHFAQGRQKLNGLQVIQFIKTVPVAERAYDVSLEHNLRKHIVFEALLESLETKNATPLFWLNLGRFVSNEIQSGVIAYDFDHNAMIGDQIGRVVIDLGKYVAQDRSKSGSPQIPRINKKKYIVDQAQGDGGVRWVDPNVDDPFMRADIQAKVYANFDMEVPYNANPYAEDLANGYWASVRSLVKNSLVDCPAPQCQPSSKDLRPQPQ